MSQTRPDRDATIVYHYADEDGYNSIRAASVWRFRAHRPPPRDDDHPTAAYFSWLPPDTRNLSRRISLSTVKLEFVFAFFDAGDLSSLRGGREVSIALALSNYVVVKERQSYCGPSDLYWPAPDAYRENSP